MKKQQVKKMTAVFALGAAAAVIATPLVADASQLKDVKPSHHFYADVMNLVERGVISGYEDGTFRPGKELTRGQAAKIIAGVLQLDTKNVVSPNFTDIPTTHQYYGAIAALKQAGIIDGFEDGTFRQGEFVQRNHIAKILANAMKLQATDVESLPFTDVRADYKETIAALYENNVTTGKTATTFDGKAFVTRGQMAAFIARAEKAVPTEQTFSVTDFTEETITIDGKTYALNQAVQDIFNEANKAALTNAKVKAIVKGTEVVAIEALTLNYAGTESEYVTFSAGKTAIGSLTINADYIEVKNTTISSNLNITKSVSTEIVLDGVTTAGDIIFENELVGAVASTNSNFAQVKSSAKLTMKNSMARSVQVNRNDVQIESNQQIAEVKVATFVTTIALQAPVKTFTVLSIEKLVVTGKAEIQEVVVTTALKLTLEIIGEVKSLVVNDEKANVTVGSEMKIEKLTVPNEMKPSQIITNFEQVAQQIENGKVEAEAINSSPIIVTVTKESAKDDANKVLNSFDYYLYVDFEAASAIFDALYYVVEDEKSTTADYQNAVKAYETALAKLEKRTPEQYAKRVAIAQYYEVIDSISIYQFKDQDAARDVYQKYGYIKEIEELTVQEIQALKKEAEQAFGNIEKVSDEKFALYLTLQKIKWITETYVDEKAASDAIAAANTVYDNETATNEQLVKAKAAVEKTLASLALKSEKALEAEIQAEKLLFDKAVEYAKELAVYDEMYVNDFYVVDGLMMHSRDYYKYLTATLYRDVASYRFLLSIIKVESLTIQQAFEDNTKANELVKNAFETLYNPDSTAEILKEAFEQFEIEVAALELSNKPKENSTVAATFVNDSGEVLDLTSGDSVEFEFEALDSVVTGSIAFSSVEENFYIIEFEEGFNDLDLIRGGFTFMLGNVRYEVRGEDNVYTIIKVEEPAVTEE